MKRDFDALTSESFDLIVIGGGIMGAGITWGAALLGINTLLLEKNDFASGTTSRSSRVIHGGLCYLQQYDFNLVRQGLLE
jgi:glycerol-3-phosphate dehydrogenase